MTTTAVTPELEPIQRTFDAVLEKLKASNDPTLAMRQAAIEFFLSQGFPTTRNEEWRFTDIRPISKLGVKPADAPARLTPALEGRIKQLRFEDAHPYQVVFVDGTFSPELSDLNGLPEGAWALPYADAIQQYENFVVEKVGQYARTDNHELAALNSALFTDGFIVFVPKNTVVERPFNVLHLRTGQAEATTFNRVFVAVETSADVTVIETFASTTDATYVTNAVTEIVAASNARVRHYKLQLEGENAYHTHFIKMAQEKDSNVENHNFSIGSTLARNDIWAKLDGENIETTMNGVYVADTGQLLDTHSVMDHMKPHCNSWEFYKGILAGKGKAVFNGKIFVRQDAQLTDAKQSNKNLLLSDDARIDTKPQLEIWADDVKCTHGATVGYLDDLALFYLQSRGLPFNDAQTLLTKAFAMEITDKVHLEPVRELLNELLTEKLDIISQALPQASPL